MREMINFLQTYIRIDTSRGYLPNYQQALNLFAQQAQQDGFLYQEITLKSGLPVGIISYNGSNSSLPSLVLNHHMDVVPVDNIDEWMADPFSGELFQDSIIGRGTQDMKGVGVVHYFALQQLKINNIIPDRTIHMVIVPDEEHGGFKGTQEFLETFEFNKLRVGYVLDEGLSSGDQQFINIKVSERKPLQIRILSKGNAAHSSSLCAHNSAHELVKFLNQITNLHQEQQQKTTSIASGLCYSMNITSLQSGNFDEKVVLNSIPSHAAATIDIRIPPTMSLLNMQQLLDKYIKLYPKLFYYIEAQGEDILWPDISDTFFYQTLQQSIEQEHKKAKLLYFEATTDLRFYIAKNIVGLGCTPFCTIPNIHGTNESITIDDLLQGHAIIYRFLKLFCTGNHHV